MYELTNADLETLRRLRKEGCAVCIFLPPDTEGVNYEDVEDAMLEAGLNRINQVNKRPL